MSGSLLFSGALLDTARLSCIEYLSGGSLCNIYALDLKGEFVDFFRYEFFSNIYNFLLVAWVLMMSLIISVFVYIAIYRFIRYVK